MKFDDYFFRELELIYKKYDFIKSKDEHFNIFSVLYKEYDEKNLHSRFIAALLDPFASHKMHQVFLHDFIKMFENINMENFENAIVYPEEWNKKENHNIDILIIDRKSKNAIIIENKIFAGDSNNEEDGQLERYFKFVRDIEKIPPTNITTFYLTLDGHEPSDESLGSFIELSNINGICIAYSDELVCWLDQCLTHVPDKPFIRETIIQYKKLINKMTQNDTLIQERREIKEKIGENESNMRSAKYLLDNFKHVKWHTVDDFFKELAFKLEQNGFTIIDKPSDENITDITHYETYRKGQKNKQDCGIVFEKRNEVRLSIWNEADEWLCWTVLDNNFTSNEYRARFNEHFKNGTFFYIENQSWWKYLFEDDNKKILLSNFSHSGTFNLINNNYREKIVIEIFDKINGFLCI
jgi:hypothetical protein